VEQATRRLCVLTSPFRKSPTHSIHILPPLACSAGQATTAVQEPAATPKKVQNERSYQHSREHGKTKNNKNVTRAPPKRTSDDHVGWGLVVVPSVVCCMLHGPCGGPPVRRSHDLGQKQKVVCFLFLIIYFEAVRTVDATDWYMWSAHAVVRQEMREAKRQAGGVRY